MRIIFGKMMAVAFIFCAAGVQGGVVENKTEDTSGKTAEGSVIHHFTEGLLLPVSGVNTGSYFSVHDIAAWLFASGNFNTPQAGDSVEYVYLAIAPVGPQPDFQGRRGGGGFPGFRPQFQMLPRWKWAKEKADSTGSFQGFNIRSSYLYASYTSPKENIVLLEASGNHRTFVNGEPHEGDYYGFDWSLVPVKLKKGLNEFVFTPGRAGRYSAKLVKTDKPVMFTRRDMTLPDLIIGETTPSWAAVRVINATEKTVKGLKISATLPDGQHIEYQSDYNSLLPLSVRKLRFQIPPLSDKIKDEGELTVKIALKDKSGKTIDETEITVKKALVSNYHTRTLVSRADGSVQFYSIAPAKRKTPGETKGLVLTVHGANVDAHVQAACYAQKEDVDIVAATNRRPYGFDWEDWGRLDALEVLAEAVRIYKPDPSRIYLTGHSMGGHGTWYLGITYPDKFAAIAPCAGYPDLGEYGGRGAGNVMEQFPAYKPFKRAVTYGRTLSMLDNLRQSGVYIFHGSEDRTVSTNEARRMRELLGKFHDDFCYYEFPGGGHWFDQCMDWKPIFEFFSRHSIPKADDVKTIDFTTASPGISATDYWLGVEQQIVPCEFTNIKAVRDNDTVRIEKADNASVIVLDLPQLTFNSANVKIVIDNKTFTVPAKSKPILSLETGEWKLTDKINTKQRYSGRYGGGFKFAFDHNAVLVYPTKGTAAENALWLNKARFDAETFWYRGNGSFEVIPDTEYSAEKYAGRNVVVYGNKNNNRVWGKLLSNSPIQVASGVITSGDAIYKGNDLGVYFLYPHPDNDVNFVGVVGATGEKGIRGAALNNYLQPITGFPEIMIFKADILRTGIDALEYAGFYDNNWNLVQQ
jgi:pimeloyl-ACP methyl ester carboxylesterase